VAAESLPIDVAISEREAFLLQLQKEYLNPRPLQNIIEIQRRQTIAKALIGGPIVIKRLKVLRAMGRTHYP
jgi:hypothetical protein